MHLFNSVLERNGQGIDFITPYEDISLGDYLLNPSKFEYSIKRQTYDYFSQEIEHKDNILGKGRDRKKLLVLT